MKYIIVLSIFLCASLFVSRSVFLSLEESNATVEKRVVEAEKANAEANEAREEVEKLKQELTRTLDQYLQANSKIEETTKAKEEAVEAAEAAKAKVEKKKQELADATDLYLKAKAEAEEAATEAAKAKAEAANAKEETKRLRAETTLEERTAVLKKRPSFMDCEGFPEWPLSPADALYDDTVGSPKCNAFPENADEYTWVLHQTSAPNRRPSVSEVTETLSHLPEGTGYRWHSDDDICAFMRTQPLRFQALFNSLERTPHRVDLWRYLLLHERGGVYLDDDAELLVQFNSYFVAFETGTKTAVVRFASVRFVWLSSVPFRFDAILPDPARSQKEKMRSSECPSATRLGVHPRSSMMGGPHMRFQTSPSLFSSLSSSSSSSSSEGG